MSKYQTPCRYDFVGSFLRPEEVKKANADYQEGKISEAEKNQIIDKAVTEVVAKQKELGFHVITDGEFRRTYWHLDFMWGFEGVGHEQTGSGVQFDGELASLEDISLIMVNCTTSRKPTSQTNALLYPVILIHLGTNRLILAHDHGRFRLPNYKIIPLCLL